MSNGLWYNLFYVNLKSVFGLNFKSVIFSFYAVAAIVLLIKLQFTALTLLSVTHTHTH